MKSAWKHLPLFGLALTLATACADTSEAPEFGSRVTFAVAQTLEQEVEDDLIDEKSPLYDPTRQLDEQFDECLVTLNKSSAVTRLDLAPFRDDEAEIEGRLFSNRAEAIDAIGLDRTAWKIPSIEVVDGYAMAIFDGVAAALEWAFQDRDDASLMGKRAFLYTLLDELSAARDELQAGLPPAESENNPTLDALEDGIVHIGAALIAGGNPVELSAALQARAEQAVEDFEADPVLSRPSGYYTWRDGLQEVYYQDRFLTAAAELAAPETLFPRYAAIAAVLAAHPDLEAWYDTYLGLHAGLHAQFASHPANLLLSYLDGLEALDDLDALYAQFKADYPEDPFVCKGSELALIPGTTTLADEYVDNLDCPGSLGPSERTELLIDAILAGDLTLDPGEDAFWPDERRYALEALVSPDETLEIDNRFQTADYKERLIGAFKTALWNPGNTTTEWVGEAVEEPPEPKAGTMRLFPLLEIEPAPTYFLRLARAFRDLHADLKSILGDELLRSETRILEDGQRGSLSLEDELNSITWVLYGLYHISAEAMGLEPEQGLTKEELSALPLEGDVLHAEAWLAGWQTDADIVRDTRALVPVASDATHVEHRARLGVQAVKLGADYYQGHEPRVINSIGCDVDSFGGTELYVLVDVVAAARIHREVTPLSRDEFRAICDLYETPEEIIAVIEALEP